MAGAVQWYGGMGVWIVCYARLRFTGGVSVAMLVALHRSSNRNGSRAKPSPVIAVNHSVCAMRWYCPSDAPAVAGLPQNNASCSARKRSLSRSVGNSTSS